MFVYVRCSPTHTPCRHPAHYWATNFHAVNEDNACILHTSLFPGVMESGCYTLGVPDFIISNISIPPPNPYQRPSLSPPALVHEALSGAARPPDDALQLWIRLITVNTCSVEMGERARPPLICVAPDCSDQWNPVQIALHLCGPRILPRWVEMENFRCPCPVTRSWVSSSRLIWPWSWEPLPTAQTAWASFPFPSPSSPLRGTH